MICYRDQSYCASDCINSQCFRYLSDEVKAGAEKCGLPIATTDFSDDCDDYVTEKKNG